MARLSFVLAMVIGSLSLATAARAADDANVSDVRCVLVGFVGMQSPDPQTKAIARGAILYFVGRVRARAPNLDLEAAISKQLSLITPQLLQAETQRCGGLLKAEGDKLTTIGMDMSKKAAASSPPAAAHK